MNIDAKLSIGRDSNDMISITIVDEASHIQFLDAHFTLEDFAYAITGLGFRPSADCEVRGLEYVGKERVSETRTVEIPIRTYEREVMQKWLIENCQEEGWILDPYLGSQRSTSTKGDKTFLHYHVFKYVDAPTVREIEREG